MTAEERPGFGRLWAAKGISNVGDGVFAAAFPLLVASLTRDPMLVAGATLAGRLPWFLFALISGALVDRMDRRTVMVTANIMRGIGVLLLGTAVVLERIDLLVIYLVAFGLGIAETFFDTSSEAIVPGLVSPDRLPAANARLEAAEFVGNSLAGPPLGAFLFALAASIPFLLNGGTFLVAALLIVLIPGTFRSDRVHEGGLFGDIGSGLAWLWGQRVVRTLSFLAGATNFFVFAVIAIFVLFAQDRLGLSDTGYGVMLAMLGVGGLLGALIAPRVVATLGSGTTLRVTLVVQAIGVVVFSQLTHPVPAGVILMLFGAGTASWNVVAVSLRQGLTPDDLRGRVAGASRTLAWGTQPIGALVGGLLASWFGLEAPFLVAGVGYFVALALTWPIISNDSINRARSAMA